MQLSAAEIAGLFPEGVVAEVGRPELSIDELYDEERAQIARAVDKRKAEYATARVLARRAFGRLGVEASPLVNDADRCPVWPASVVGSIAHTKGVCVVVVAPRSRVGSVGVDVELDEPVRQELFDRICTPAELAWISSQRDADAGQLVKLVFSAKEAFYKCQYPLTRKYLGFHAVEVAIDRAGSTFEVALRERVGQFGDGDRFGGVYRAGAGFVVTAMAR